MTSNAEKNKAGITARRAARRLKPFALTYALVTAPSLLRLLSKSEDPIRKRLESALRLILSPRQSTLKLASFPALIPILYQRILPLIHSLPLPPHIRPYASELAAAVVSPLILLLPHGLRVYLALYAFSGALTTFLKSEAPIPGEEGKRDGQVKGWRKNLPPVWSLNMVFNSWMVWSWFHEKGVFPKSYEKLILEHSPHYCPPSNTLGVRDFLETTLNPRVPASEHVPGGHTYVVCKTLHPDEPNCSVNHFKAWRDEVPIVGKWVAGFGAFSTGLSMKKRVFSEPLKALSAWADYTIRGTLYVTGSIQTVWSVACLLQRVIPGDFMPKSRWVINGSVASLWIFALPPKRRTEISVYVARIGILSVWRAWLKHFPRLKIKYGETIIFAAAWAFLLQLRAGGWRIEGLMARAIRFIEGSSSSLDKGKGKATRKDLERTKIPLPATTPTTISTAEEPVAILEAISAAFKSGMTSPRTPLSRVASFAKGYRKRSSLSLTDSGFGSGEGSGSEGEAGGSSPVNVVYEAEEEQEEEGEREVFYDSEEGVKSPAVNTGSL